jgi:hypothetical protein
MNKSKNKNILLIFIKINFIKKENTENDEVIIQYILRINNEIEINKWNLIYPSFLICE